MTESIIAVCTCDICGDDLFDGDSANGITTGSISTDDDGFMADGEEWGTVCCDDCMEKVQDLIDKMEVARV